MAAVTPTADDVRAVLRFIATPDGYGSGRFAAALAVRGDLGIAAAALTLLADRGFICNVPPSGGPARPGAWWPTRRGRALAYPDAAPSPAYDPEPPADPTGVDCAERYEGIAP